MSLLRLLICLFCLALPVSAQEAPETPAPDRSSTGGATTLEDILARQRGEKVDDTYRSGNTGQGNVEALIGQLGTRGVASDSDIYRALRYGSADISVSSRGPGAAVITQDPGMRWPVFRPGPLREYGT